MQASNENSPTILVVEDEALIGMMIEDILVQAGFRVVHATNGPQAVNIAESDAVLAAAVVDLNRGNGMDGRDVLRRLRQRQPGLPAVVSTGFHADAVQADLRGLGGPTMRLEKPFDDNALLGMLAAVMDRPVDEHMPVERERRHTALV